MTYLETLTRHALRASIQPGDKLRLEPNWLITDDTRQMIRRHRDELVREIAASSATADPSGEIAPDYHILMVATNLDSWEADDPRFGCEVMLDVCYRQLDAAYYAWLRHCMENARNAHETGALDDATFGIMRERFNVIHEWAVRHIAEEALRRAIRTANVGSYVQPSEQTFAAYRKTWDDAWNAYMRSQALGSQLSDQASRLACLLSTQGYAGIRSAIVGDIVVIVRDDTAAVPDKWSGRARFTLDELSLITGSSPDAVKQIHEVKRMFGGKVVPMDESDSRLFPEKVPAVSDQQPRQLALECTI